MNNEIRNIHISTDTNKIQKTLKNLKEGLNLEMKTAKSSLPRDFWLTFSSFSNTIGGTVIFGISEGLNENTIVGVDNPDKVIDELFTTLNNNNKVSYSNLNDSNVTRININDKTIIILHIPEVNNKYKPVYINGQLQQSYIRKHSSDIKLTEIELRAMLRNAEPNFDSLCVEDMGLEALDSTSIASFKERISIRYSSKGFDKMSHEEFLHRINAIAIHNGIIKLKKGTLLFLGKYNFIKKEFPHYFLDYINRSTGNSRWVDRVSSDELSDIEMNIYNFFNIVFDKLRTILVSKFEIDDNSFRVKPPSFDIAIREALTNCLAHADYEQSFPSIKIEACPGMFIFTNPGQMLIPVAQFISGGDSRPRNETIMTFFRYLGISERQGEGGPSIFQSAAENEYRTPDVNTNIESTTLTLWHVDFLESHPELVQSEKDIFIYLQKNGMSKSKDIQNELGLTEYKVRKYIDSLKEKGIVVSVGEGRSTRYMIKDPTHLITLMQSTLNSMRELFSK